MELLRNIKDGEYGLEGKVFLELFDKYIEFSAEDCADIEYVKKCASYLNSLPQFVLKNLCQASACYCNEFLDEVGETEKEFGDFKEVLDLIYPSTLIVPNPKNGDEPVIHMELNCWWEEEHGMEWIVRQDRVLYVGAFNGENPWGDFSKKEPWNYA